MKFGSQAFWAVGKDTFTNGNLTIVTTPVQTGQNVYDITGWTVYNKQVYLNGASTIEGWPTPTDSTKPSNSPGDQVIASGGYAASYGLSTDVPLGYPAGSHSVRLSSDNNNINYGYGIVRGPYMVSNDALTLEAGNSVEFWWKAAGGGDAYDVYGYLLNVANGSTIELINSTGTSSGLATPWTKVTKVIPDGKYGTYKFVFISGSYDLTGGRLVGASLYITGAYLQRTVYPPTIDIKLNTPSIQGEGNLISATITTGNIGSEIYYWSIIPVSGNVTSQDFDTNSLTGSLIIDVDSQRKGSGNISFSTVNDLKREGTETFRIQLEAGDFNRHVVYTSNVISILDTSVNSFSINIAAPTTVNEGDTVTSYSTIVAGEPGDTYWITLLPVSGNVNAADFGEWNASIVQDNGNGNLVIQANIPISSDFKTEGIETFKVQLRRNSETGEILVTSPETVTINDTSRGFAINARSFYGTNTVNEGEVIFVDVYIPEDASLGMHFIVLTDDKGPITGFDFSNSYGTTTAYAELPIGLYPETLPGKTYTFGFLSKENFYTDGPRSIKAVICPSWPRSGYPYPYPNYSRYQIPDTNFIIGESGSFTLRDVAPSVSDIIATTPSGPNIVSIPADQTAAIIIKFTYLYDAAAEMATGYRAAGPSLIGTPDSDTTILYSGPNTFMSLGNPTITQRRGLVKNAKAKVTGNTGVRQDQFGIDLSYFTKNAPVNDPLASTIVIDFVAAWVNTYPSNRYLNVTAEFYSAPSGDDIYPDVVNNPSTGDNQMFIRGPNSLLRTTTVRSLASLDQVWNHGDGSRNIVRFVYDVATRRGYFNTDI